MSKVQPLAIEIGGSNKFRIYNDIDWDTHEERDRFLNRWINQKLSDALDDGTVKAEFEMWRDELHKRG